MLFDRLITDESLIRSELESAGYELHEEHDFIEKQYFLIAEGLGVGPKHIVDT